MGTPSFKFQIFNDTLYPSGIVVNIPLGWNGAVLKLERHKDYHSLVEFFESNFLWYGSARDIIREIEDAQGVDAKIRLLVEIRYNNAWETLFDGQIDISQIEDLAKANTFYKAKAPIITNDFWSKFINRKSIPVDVDSDTDLDGGTRSHISSFTLPLPSQVIRVISNYIESFGTAISESVVSDGDYIQVGFNGIITDEAKTNFNLPTDKNSIIPVGLWGADSDGVYSFDISISSSKYKVTLPGVFPCTPTDVYEPISASLQFYFQKNEEAPIAFTALDSSVIFTKRGTKYTISVPDLNLIKGDQIRIYGDILNNTWEGGDYASIIIWGENNSDVLTFLWDAIVIDPDTLACGFFGSSFQTKNHGDIPDELEIPFFNIEGNTVYMDTDTDAFLIKDVAESILSKITANDNVIESDYFESCGKPIALMKGLHVRGYSFADKKFFQSFDDWWDGANPLLAIGLGYVDGENKIEIERIENFYDNVPAINFSNVPDLVRTYDLDSFFKSVETGFQKWSAESDGGLDDPQTKQTRRTRFSNFGNDKKILSKLFMSSLGIERSRRNRVIFNNDDRLDEETIGIRLKTDLSGPELGADFVTTNLFNPNERYNVRDTPATIFLRWQSVLQNCLQSYPSDKFIFTGGEGNYDLIKEFPSDDCEFPDIELAENQDINVTDDFTFIPKVYKCTIPMTYGNYKTIKANRKKAIGISRTDEDHIPMFIIELDFRIMSGSAELTLMSGANINL